MIDVNFSQVIFFSESNREEEKLLQTEPRKSRNEGGWLQNKSKQRRMEGEAYLGRKKNDAGEYVTRKPRVIGESCQSEQCKIVRTGIVMNSTMNTDMLFSKNYGKHLTGAARSST